MPEVKARWLHRLRRVDPKADLRYNYAVGRWEFILDSADGVPRSQFWGWYKNPMTGAQLKPDPVTGLFPFRDVDDASLEEACINLEKTFVGNPYDGAGSTRKEVSRRIRFNRDAKERHYKALGEAWADRFVDRIPRMNGNPSIGVITDRGRGVLLDAYGRPVNAKTKPAAQLVDPQGKPVTKAA